MVKKQVESLRDSVFRGYVLCGEHDSVPYVVSGGLGAVAVSCMGWQIVTESVLPEAMCVCSDRQSVGLKKRPLLTHGLGRVEAGSLGKTETGTVPWKQKVGSFGRIRSMERTCSMW